MSQIALQWSLNKAGDDVLAVGKDFIMTATNDNIQPLALLACEKFGATLPINFVTRTKIEILLKSQAPSVFVKFIKAQIGYDSNDSVVQLSRSLAGLNFLALATALVCTMKIFDAGVVLEKMITASAADKTLVPTAYHLKGLLEIIEPRVNRAGFLNDVMGWKDLLSAHGSFSDDHQRLLRLVCDTFPDLDGIDKLVRALRNVSRVGEATSVVITARLCCPWLIAFTKWCIGVPPAVYNSNGDSILEQSDSPVTIIYSEKEQFDNLDIRIELHFDAPKFDEVLLARVVEPQRSLGSMGMVSIQVYANHILQREGLHTNGGKRALLTALPYALKQARELCLCQASSTARLDQGTLPSPTALMGNPFPSEDIIAQTAARFLPLNGQFVLKQLDEGSLVSDKEVVQTWERENNSSSGSMPRPKFVKAIGEIVATILALSLFNECLDSVQVSYSRSIFQRQRHRLFENWVSVIEDILSTGQRKECSVDCVLQFALGLLQHDVSADLDTSRWVASSFQGQTVFPKVFEDRILRTEGYLELFCLPGELRMDTNNKKRFSLVRSPSQEHLARSSDEFLSENITGISNLYPSHQLIWKENPLDDSIEVSLGWSRDISTKSPLNVLRALTRTVFVACPHSPQVFLTAPPKDFRYQTPMEGPMSALPFSSEFEAVVIPVSGDDGLRMIALSSIVWRLKTATKYDGMLVVVNQGACISCLLDKCRATGCRYVVL